MQSFLGQTILGIMTQYACFRFPVMIDSSKIDDEALCNLFSENRTGKNKSAQHLGTKSHVYLSKINISWKKAMTNFMLLSTKTVDPVTLQHYFKVVNVVLPTKENSAVVSRFKQRRSQRGKLPKTMNSWSNGFQLFRGNIC